MSEEKDPFYDNIETMKESAIFQQELEEYEEDGDLDALLEQVESEEPIDLHGQRETWQLTAEEEKQLTILLDKKKREDLILKTFTSLENRPSDETIEEWKIKFGDIYLVSLSEKENFIIRPLKRLEWRQLITAIAKFPETKKTDAIAMKATVWPKLTESNVAALTAGATETLRSLIFEASNFIDPERALQLVRKL